MATCNIEGIRSNVALAESLLKTYDIVFFQEHWLFGFEQNYLQDLFDKNNTDCIIRSIDDGDPITLHQRPRGYGGIAVAYNNNLAKHIQPLPDSRPYAAQAPDSRLHDVQAPDSRPYATEAPDSRPYATEALDS